MAEVTLKQEAANGAETEDAPAPAEPVAVATEEAPPAEEEQPSDG